MRIEDYPLEPRFAATVLRTERITDDAADEEVREIVLEIDRRDYRYRVGQCIGVLIDGPHQFGQSVHHRLYSIADIPLLNDSGKPEVTIAVRRCNYIDDYSGELHAGVSSNFLCDRRAGDSLVVTGPFTMPFCVPDDKRANLVLIGLGTGIAPFRSLVKYIYEHVDGWGGRILLLHGARSGLELLYMNDKRDDFAKYYDEESFEAISVLSARPDWADPIAWDSAIDSRAEEILSMLDDPHTFVYVAGLQTISTSLDNVFNRICGSTDEWQEKKSALRAEGRWLELIY